MSEELPRYLNMLNANVSMLRQALSNIKDEIDAVKKVIDADKKEKEETEELKAKLVAEFKQRQRGQKLFEELIEIGDVRSFKILFEQVGRGKWYCRNKTTDHLVDARELMKHALEKSNVDICEYLTEYVSPDMLLYWDEGTIFHKAVRVGSFDVLKSICESYQRLDPERFKRSIKHRCNEPKRFTPYEYAVSRIGKTNYPYKYHQYKEIAEYLQQFE